jgi:protein tyrosine/serine phosphatase
MTPAVDFEGIANFRDFGGYAGAGGRLRTGLLYRSAHPAHATDTDLARLADLSIQVVVDLRRPEERAREPGRRWPGFSGLIIENDIAEISQRDASAAFAEGVGSFRGGSRDFYRRAPFEPRYVDLFSRYFRALAEVDGPILIHCASGKDRTGLACALTHLLAGVGADDLVGDYLATNDALALRLPAYRALARQATGKAPDDATLLAAFQAEPGYLAAAFTAIIEAHGSTDAYMERVLGVDQTRRQRILRRLMADGEEPLQMPPEVKTHQTARK